MSRLKKKYKAPARKRLNNPVVILFILVVLFALGFYVYHKHIRRVLATTYASSSIYWGGYVKGETYGQPNVDPPWNWMAVDTFEANAGGKKMSLFQSVVAAWANNAGNIAFSPYQMNLIKARGYIPYLDWQSRKSGAPSAVDQPTYSLQAIIRGDHDAFITEWATGAKNWGYPFFLRFNAEMNGTWWAWSESRNGNSPGEFAQAWRHVHDIFTQVGANNATWVWCPNVDYPGSIALEGLYPGDAYVDWTCMDGYNWGSGNPNHVDSWKSFSQVFTPTYNHLLAIAPAKPIFIGEFASDDRGGDKVEWITDALTTQLPLNFPQVKAISWFNLNVDGANWVIETSPAAQSAFAAGIASSYYAPNIYGNLPTGTKIQPIPDIAPTPTPTPTPSISSKPRSTPTPRPTPSPKRP